MDWLRLALRGLWWRRGLALLVLVIATATAAAAAAGPLYLRAAGESVLRDTLASSLPAETGIEVNRVAPAGSALPTSLVARVRSARPPAAYPTLFGALEYDAPITDQASGVALANTVFTSKDDVCAHVLLVQGRCIRAPGEVVLPADALAVSPLLAVGRRFLAPGMTRDDGSTVTLTVVGRYRPRAPDSTYWWGAVFGPSRSGEGSRIDPVLVTSSTFTGLSRTVGVRQVVRLPLDVAAVRWSDVPGLRRDVGPFVNGLRADPSHPAVFAHLDEQLDAAARYRDALELPVSLVAVQLVLLGWVVLFTALGNAVRARSVEIALAKIRGFPVGATLAFGLLELATVLAVAAPLGVVIGWFGVHALASRELAPATPVTLDLRTVAAVAVAVGGGIVAAVLTALRLLRSDVVDLLQRSTPTRSRIVRAAGVSALAVGAAVALISIGRATPEVTAAGGTPDVSPDITGLLLPGLVSVVIALAGLPVVAGLCRLLVSATRARRPISLFLAVRQVARRPAGMRVVLMLAVALGLATFTVAAYSVFATNRHDRALAENGAARVLSVGAPNGDLRALVRQADPSGHFALAVSSLQDDEITIVGADMSRYAGIGYWRGDLADASLSSVRHELEASPTTGALPVLVTREAAFLTDADRLLAPDGTPTRASVIGSAAFIPGFGPRAVLVDLGAWSARATGVPNVTHAVWLAPHTPAQVLDRLSRAGIRPYAEDTAEQRSTRFSRQPPALALLLFLAGAAVAAVLAAGGAVLDMVQTARRRRFEVAAMIALGIPPRTLRRAMFVEHIVLLGSGVLFGLGAGLLALAVTLPRVPEYVDTPSLPALVVSPAPWVVAAIAGVMVACVLAAVGAASYLMVRHSDADLLREAQT